MLANHLSESRCDLRLGSVRISGNVAHEDVRASVADCALVGTEHLVDIGLAPALCRGECMDTLDESRLAARHMRSILIDSVLADLVFHLITKVVREIGGQMG